ncbi:uncharacterized protein RJT20DRAFT_144512 [Scheffersomyces xylosifermentans]|uniref:uncharacterized protein n=1 Tax=Scheffersomyces xylosifermentans TaxID=1304137 RepID=UPI00315DCEC2
MLSLLRRQLFKSPIVRNQILQQCCISNVQVPFQDDLSAADNDDFNLGDFQHYKESDDIIAMKLELANPTFHNDKEKVVPKPIEAQKENSPFCNELSEVVGIKEPMVFVSKLTNPYLNLAVEDYIYNQMPKPEDPSTNYNRLMFYINSPCVVIGKNQNPWKEVNLPLLNSLHIPLIRRRSGGGTVVHDQGNVNYSFMTTKERFDRFTFANIIKDAVNASNQSKYQLEVNDRGDITTTTQEDGINYKISGSAYKLSKGKSYHHGTMLLNSRLDILGKLLSRDETKLGVVDATNSISSVKSKVTNLEIDSQTFIDAITSGFKESYGLAEEINRGELSLEEQEALEQNELLGLGDFIEANSNSRFARVVTVDDATVLPDAVNQMADELKSWGWRYGGTPKFTHQLSNDKFGFKVKFIVGKGAILEGFELEFIGNESKLISEKKITESFKYLEAFIKNNKLEYTGSNVAGFITNDFISDWVGESIDGTI